MDGLSGPMGGGMPGMAGMGGGAGPAAKDDDPSVVVIWNPGNQKEITQTHFGMAMNNASPSTLEVLYAQEDLWVFQNLMGIIKATNGDALRKHEAAIKVIEYVPSASRLAMWRDMSRSVEAATRPVRAA